MIESGIFRCGDESIDAMQGSDHRPTVLQAMAYPLECSWISASDGMTQYLEPCKRVRQWLVGGRGRRRWLSIRRNVGDKLGRGSKGGILDRHLRALAPGHLGGIPGLAPFGLEA